MQHTSSSRPRLKSVYTEKNPRPPSSYNTSPRLPPKPRPDILPREINLHILLPLRSRVDRLRQPLRPLERGLIEALGLFAHEADEVARDVGALALGVAEVLLDAAAERVDAFADFFAVEVGEQVAGCFA